jgi:hypothetical protein
VLLVVYLGLGIFHAYCFFKLSKKTFVPQAMTMGFCFSRVVSLSLRMAWTEHVTNKNLAIAASVFINAGVLLLVLSPVRPRLTLQYLVNVIFVHRLALQVFTSIPTRRRYPLNAAAFAYMFSTLPLLILVIVPGIQLFLSSDPSTISTDRKILRFAQCYLTVMVCLPVVLAPIIWISYFQRKVRAITPKEVTLRAGIVFTAGSLLVWIQAVKILQGFYTPTAETAVNPPWFLQRPILYSGFFLPEILIVILFAVSNIRTRFVFPNREEERKSVNNLPEDDGGSGGTMNDAEPHDKVESV